MQDINFNNKADTVNQTVIIQNIYINASEQLQSQTLPTKDIHSLSKQKSIDWNDVASFIKKNWKQIVALLICLFPSLCH